MKMKTAITVYQLNYINSYDDDMPLTQSTHLFMTKDDAKQWLKESNGDDEVDEVFLEDLALAMDEDNKPLFTDEELTGICPDFDPDNYPERGDYYYGWQLSTINVLTREQS